MQLMHKQAGDTLNIFLIGELDEHTADYIKIKMDNLFASTDFKKVIIDFKDLEFMDSTGVGMLINRYKQLSVRKIPIFLRNPNSQMERIFKMSGLYTIMPKAN